MTSTSARSTSARKVHRLTSWRQRLSTLPPSQSEDSAALRVLVQSLVTVGICALTVAATGVTDTSIWNLIAIPGSVAGAYWSWRNRKRRNIAAKFCIAIGMLLALVFFFWKLLNEPGDTRIVLAELLIHLQVLHSFDLPRRKDLGYSMMIGLILLGVAATISQTLAFGPLLLCFLIIALPVLSLDYRARLGLHDHSWQGLPSRLLPRQLGLVFLVTLLLGMGIFAALPRLPGYQLRTFPVSGSMETEGNFDGRAIFNPGYIRGGNGDQAGNSGTAAGGKDSGQSPEVGPGRISTDFYYGFNQRMNQNLRGEMIPKVVMRVRSQTAGFWRVMAFDHYTGQGWEVSRNDQSTKTYRSPVSYQFFLPRLNRQGAHQEVVQTYTMVSDFQNLVPTLYEPAQIYFPSEELAVDPEGGLRAPKPLVEGLTYTVISDVPLRLPQTLKQAKATYSNNIKTYYLQLPETLQPRLQRETERLLATSPLPLRTAFDKADYLTKALKETYTLQESLPFFEKDEDLAEAFLFKYRGGTADHFSTVLTVMLRSIGIPARLVAGFSAGEFNPFTGFYIVRNTDAYAMTEVFFPEQGWFTFDPIPGHLPVPPSVEDADPFSVLKRLWEWLQGALPLPVARNLQSGFQFLAQVLSGMIGFLARFTGQGWLSGLWGAIALTTASFVGWLTWQGWQGWRRQRWLNRLAPMEKVYQQMLQQLERHGYAKARTQTPFEFVGSLKHQADFEYQPLIESITQAYVRWRYGGELPDLGRVRSQLQQLQKRPQSSTTAANRRAKA